MAVVSVLLETPSYAVGTFRCPPSDARWREENWIGTSHVLAFPRRAVLIAKSRRRMVVANPNHVVLYNPDETYRRSLLAPEGDESTFIALDARLAEGLLPESAGSASARFPAPESPLSDSAAFRLHELELWLRRPPEERDPGAMDELMVDLVTRVLPEGCAGPSGMVTERPSTADERRALVDDTRTVLSVTFRDQLSLASIARLVGSSPFHLARTFRASTGRSLHEYREQLRLREALHRVRDGDGDLARLATDLGFASHSHFTDRFRRAFAASPSSARRLEKMLPAAGRREMRTISEAPAGSAA